MQALRNKISKKNKNRNPVSAPKFVEERTETFTTTDQTGAPVTTTTTTVTESLSQGSTTPSFSSIPTPPSMPPNDFWKSGSPGDYNAYFLEEYYAPQPDLTASRKTIEVLPVQHIEKPAIIHEEIRSEQIEEIQPIVQVEIEKTEVHQITQPLLDTEIRSVQIEERTLPAEIRPTIETLSTSVRAEDDQSTTVVEQTVRQVVEKEPIIKETEKWRIIEEVQPIIYRETIVPHVIKITRPMREVIVEQPLFMETTLQRREMYGWEREKYARFMSVPRNDLYEKEIVIMSKDLGTKVIPVNRVETQQHVNFTKETMSSTTVTQQVADISTTKTGPNMRSSAPVMTKSTPTLNTQSYVQPTKAI